MTPSLKLRLVLSDRRAVEFAWKTMNRLLIPQILFHRVCERIVGRWGIKVRVPNDSWLGPSRQERPGGLFLGTVRSMRPLLKANGFAAHCREHFQGKPSWHISLSDVTLFHGRDSLCLDRH